jgi:hypothetical protein
LPNIIRTIKSVGWDGQGMYHAFGRRGKYIGFWCESQKRPLGRTRRRWENIKMDLRDIWSFCMDWIDLVQDREQFRGLANTVINPGDRWLLMKASALWSYLLRSVMTFPHAKHFKQS